jgi:glycine/serine hydroxymethyltransferase
MVQVAEWIDQAILNRDNEAKLKEQRKTIKEFAADFPLPSSK